MRLLWRISEGYENKKLGMRKTRKPGQKRVWVTKSNRLDEEMGMCNDKEGVSTATGR